MTARPGAGHRSVAHTADLRIEAWAPTRQRCIAEAVHGMVDSFADAQLPSPDTTVECAVAGERDEDLLVGVLDEVIYRMETRGELPVATEVSPTAKGVRVRFRMVDSAAVVSTGSVPKAVSLHELRIAPHADGWSCSVTIDV
ncbi:hypothetical protein SacmaDRAFT_3056 [Saccharomonospora marina XMU15]|uniref:Archease domain-containing protein n=1 Tax=Saccharomonospora marina XMU15 TaxID=882083 RepID=H5X6R9_9PSEU|nr:archease [Saccharomonospora marina]EHR51292.1 hypothetical protein SacmaDRAFT_3056 [Saccharomonospora marina XMU15]